MPPLSSKQYIRYGPASFITQIYIGDTDYPNDTFNIDRNSADINIKQDSVIANVKHAKGYVHKISPLWSKKN